MANIDKDVYKRNKAAFLVSFGFIAIALIWAGFATKEFRHPLMHWIVLIVLSIGLIAWTYAFAKHNESISVNMQTGQTRGHLWGAGFMIAAYILYGIITFASATTAIQDHKQLCRSKTPLANSEGYIPDTKKFIEFYNDCPGNTMVLDGPAQDFINVNHKLPSWIMSKDGYTSDPVGWLQYYKASDKNPYDLSSLTAQELQDFYEQRKFPDRLLK